MAASTVTETTYTVWMKGSPVSFTSTLSESSVHEILGTLSSSFAMDLYRKWNRLSEAQYTWAVKLCQDHLDNQKRFERQNYNFGGLIDMIRSAQNNGLKRIKVRLGDIILKPGKNDRVYVLSATETQEGYYGSQPKYLGWINETQTSLRDEELIAILEDAATDPIKAAKLHGQRTGHCSCCGRELTNSLSISMGIGPICAEKFGLM